MIKSKFCNDHFALNCKLCGAEEPAVVETPNIIKESIENFKAGQQILTNLTELGSGEAHGPAGLQPNEVRIVPIIQSEEAQAVLSITDEYAKACDAFKLANDAVANTRQHIDKMEHILDDLMEEVATKKKIKDDLKRKVLETLAMGGE